MRLKFSSDIYPLTFIVNSGKDFEWMMDRLIEEGVNPDAIKNQLANVASGDAMDYTAGFRLDFGRVQCMWVLDSLKWGTADTYIHEALHMVWAGMEFLGIDDQEAWCYTMDFVVRNIVKKKAK